MKVNLSALTTFTFVDLARQMAGLGDLQSYYTALPGWMTPGIPREKIVRNPILLAPLYMARQLGSRRLHDAFNWPTVELFDRWVAGRMSPCDVFHSLSSNGLRGHRLAKDRFGALTVCDHGSTHILHNDEVLRQEYTRWGVPYTRVDPRFVDKLLAEFDECDVISLPSSFTVRSFEEKGVPSGKLVKVPFGVDLSQFYPVEKTDDVFRVLYVGQLSLRKGIPYLLEALGNLDLPNYEIMLIGTKDPVVEPFLERYSRSLRYVGAVPRKELYRYYSQASVFVIASIEEGLAVVQAQAMACGVPVVATANTGAEDLFEDGVEGFIVPARDPQAIRDRVMQLYEDPDLRGAMGVAALRRVKELGGWDRYGASVTAMYREALARVRGTGPLETGMNR